MVRVIWKRVELVFAWCYRQFISKECMAGIMKSVKIWNSLQVGLSMLEGCYNPDIGVAMASTFYRAFLCYGHQVLVWAKLSC